MLPILATARRCNFKFLVSFQIFDRELQRSNKKSWQDLLESIHFIAAYIGSPLNWPLASPQQKCYCFLPLIDCLLLRGRSGIVFSLEGRKEGRKDIRNGCFSFQIRHSRLIYFWLEEDLGHLFFTLANTHLYTCKWDAANWNKLQILISNRSHNTT